MRTIITVAVAALLTAAPAIAQDFQREGDGERRAALDAMEGKAPPALSVTQWMNVSPKGGLSLAGLEGKVVLLDFWGTW